MAQCGDAPCPHRGRVALRRANRLTRNLDGNPITWSYDDLYRLTGQHEAGQVCTHDAADKITTMIEGANLTTYTWTGYGALASEVTGSATTAYSYSGQDQLIGLTDSAGVRSTYSFSGDGLRRTAQNGNVQPTTMVWDGSDYLLLNGPSSNTVVLTIGGEIVSVGNYDLLPDSLGSVIGDIRSGQDPRVIFDYWPYGTLADAAVKPGFPFLFVGSLGYYTDSTDRDYVRARELMKSVGRWMQTDPLWPSERAFEYALGSPVQHRDPIGLQITGFLLPPNEMLDMLPEVWGTLRDLCKKPFTYEYGNWCGLNKRCNASDAAPGGMAKDCLDRACAIHDQCLATALEYFNPIRQYLCNKAFCHAIKRCYRILCTPHRDRSQCNAAMTVGMFYCGLVGERFP